MGLTNKTKIIDRLRLDRRQIEMGHLSTISYQFVRNYFVHLCTLIFCHFKSGHALLRYRTLNIRRPTKT